MKLGFMRINYSPINDFLKMLTEISSEEGLKKTLDYFKKEINYIK